MLRKIGALAAVLLLTGCPKPASNPDRGLLSKPGPATDLPDIPVEVSAETRAPMVGHDPAAASPLLAIMVKENARWMEQMTSSPAPAYYIGYAIHEKKIIALEAESGALTVDADEQMRALDVEVRVGSPELDNRHPLRDSRVEQLTNFQHVATMPRGEDPQAISHHLYLETDRRYREALRVMSRIATEQSMGSKDLPPDFSHEKPETFIQPIAKLEFDREQWEARVRECSKKAVKKGVATRGSCRIDAEINTVYFVNSEGSVIQQSWTTSRFAVNVGVKADDGMPLGRLEQEFAPTPADLPGLERENEMIAMVAKDLDDLHKAPIVAPWSGPIILEGRASAVFFHEVFGHRIEGHRQKSTLFGKTFTSQIGKQIMPDWLSVYDDPTINKLNGIFLNGFYHFDSEGVKAQRVDMVDKGVLKGFIMGRSPIDGFASSNGHGRAEIGLPPVARQGNLVVESSRSVTKDELYKRLIDEVKAQGKEFGMVITDISGGFTKTSVFDAQTFKVEPIMAYRVYVDGRKELVRGVDISGLPLSVLDNVEAAARPLETFNGICGAESGWVPVSASAPSLLVKTIEVERGYEPNNIDPVLPPPSIRARAEATR